MLRYLTNQGFAVGVGHPVLGFNLLFRVHPLLESHCLVGYLCFHNILAPRHQRRTDAV